MCLCVCVCVHAHITMPVSVYGLERCLGGLLLLQRTKTQDSNDRSQLPITPVPGNQKSLDLVSNSW